MGFTDDNINKGSICSWQVKQYFVFSTRAITGYQLLVVIKLTWIQISYLELHILITKASFNISQETYLHVFYYHSPSLEGQSRLSVWNNGAKRSIVGLDSLRSCYASVTNDTLLKTWVFLFF